MSVYRFSAGIVVVLLMALVACGGGQSDVLSEVEVTRGVESEIEVTRIVEVEVTRLVEVEVTRVVAPTATPEPPATATPDAPEIGTLESPVPLGESTAITKNGDQNALVTVLEVLRGDEAIQMAVAANQFNEPGPEGFEIVLARVAVEYLEGEGVFEIGNSSVSSVTNNQVIEYFDFAMELPCCVEPEFELQLLPGGTGEGWAKMMVQDGDPAPLMLLGDPGDGVYFSLAN